MTTDPGRGSVHRPIYKGRVVELGIESVELPDGRTLDLEIVHHPGGAVVACVNENLEICLIHQLRHAAGGWIWELPAGLLEANEPPLETAKRELIEETGVIGRDWQSLGVILSTPGFCDERLHLFLTGVETLGEAQPEADEFLEVHWVPLHEAVAKALSGDIADAKTVVGILRAAKILNPVESTEGHITSQKGTRLQKQR